MCVFFPHKKILYFTKMSVDRDAADLFDCSLSYRSTSQLGQSRQSVVKHSVIGVPVRLAVGCPVRLRLGCCSRGGRHEACFTHFLSVGSGRDEGFPRHRHEPTTTTIGVDDIERIKQSAACCYDNGTGKLGVVRRVGRCFV